MGYDFRQCKAPGAGDRGLPENRFDAGFTPAVFINPRSPEEHDADFSAVSTLDGAKAVETNDLVTKDSRSKFAIAFI